jgi:hypothetical protein
MVHSPANGPLDHSSADRQAVSGRFQTFTASIPRAQRARSASRYRPLPVDGIVRRPGVLATQAPLSLAVPDAYTLAPGSEVSKLGLELPTVVEELGGPVALHPFFEDAHVRRDTPRARAQVNCWPPIRASASMRSPRTLKRWRLRIPESGPVASGPFADRKELELTALIHAVHRRRERDAISF